MNVRTPVLVLCGVGAIAALVRCGGSSSAPPTQPSTPVTTTTTTTQPAGITLPAGMVCSPTPPPLDGMLLKVHDATNPDRLLLDSKPIVVNVDGYCARVGTGGETQKWCETRKEGDPQRVACDYLAVGQATDTGRWGPTWTWNGKQCGGANDGYCNNHPSEQFMAIAKASGHYEACAAPNARVDPNETRCGGIDITLPYVQQ